MDDSLQKKPFLLRKENRHLWYALILPVYLISFFAVEKIVKVEDCWVSYLPLDDKIPFLEGFAIPYVLWYPLLVAVGLYLMFRDPEGFKRYMLYIGVGFMGSLVLYLIWPNMQPLRPDSMPRDNLLTRLMELLYTADTNTNVCPSIHVVGCVAAICGVMYNKALRKKPLLVTGVLILGVLITISTVFVKQHSILDIFAAIPYSLVVWFLVYPLPKMLKKK